MLTQKQKERKASNFRRRMLKAIEEKRLEEGKPIFIGVTEINGLLKAVLQRDGNVFALDLKELEELKDQYIINQYRRCIK